MHDQKSAEGIVGGGEGGEPQRAWRSSVNGRGPWWNAGALHMQQAYPNAWFQRLGLVSIHETVVRLQRVH